jgi:hypothetical protein
MNRKKPAPVSNACPICGTVTGQHGFSFGTKKQP